MADVDNVTTTHHHHHHLHRRTRRLPKPMFFFNYGMIATANYKDTQSVENNRTTEPRPEPYLLTSTTVPTTTTTSTNTATTDELDAGSQCVSEQDSSAHSVRVETVDLCSSVTPAGRGRYVRHSYAKPRDRADSVKSGEQEKSTGNTVDLPPRQPTSSGTGTARHKVNKSASYASSIPEVEITIPNDGSLASFSTDSMAAFFRCLRVEERLVGHLHKTGVDGRKFGRLKDSDLDTLQINNPVIVFFRDRTAPAANKKPAKNRLPFVL